MYKQELLKIKPETGQQILDINNAVREFVKLYSKKRNTRLVEQQESNFGRYCLLRFHGEPEYIFFKFTRDPYFKAKHGLSETINLKEVKRLVRLYNKGLLNKLFFALDNGYFYTIRLHKFLKPTISHIETESRHPNKTKYVVVYKHLKRFK